MSFPVTTHFSVDEFTCHDGTPYPISQIDAETNDGRTWLETRLRPLCEMLEIIRAAGGGVAMTVDSGFRTIAYDGRIYDAHVAALKAQGLPDDHLVAEPTSSEHPEGRAGDMTHSTMRPVALFNLILSLYEAGRLPQLGGVGLYPSFVHVDVRARPRSSGGANDGHLAIWGGTRPTNVA